MARRIAQLLESKADLTGYLGTSILWVEMASQSPIKVHEQTKERIRYLAALTDATQADLVERAVAEFAKRHADEIVAGMRRAREVLAGGDATIAAYLLDEPLENVKRVAGRSA
jgi:predicted transcriptional regulator